MEGDETSEASIFKQRAMGGHLLGNPSAKAAQYGECW